MSQTPSNPSVAGAERLARFILYNQWIRADGTARADAFIPPPDLELSVTRHANLSAGELWQHGTNVSVQRGRPLIGRADIAAEQVRAVHLDVVAAEVPENLEHAHVVGWPFDKPVQKMLAAELAARSVLVRKP